MTKKACISRLFSIVTRSENHVKIAGFLTTIQTPIFQKKFTKNALGNSFLPQGTIVSIHLFYCCAASLTTPLYGHHRRDVFVWRKLGAKGKQENEEICERTI